jgi:predicted ribosome quality control (RQC) complex YloA/Tae2 family protein
LGEHFQFEAWAFFGNIFDEATRIERLVGLVRHIGEGYETTEVKDILDETYMGYATRIRLEGERKGAAERRLEKENERLKREIEKLSRKLETA